HLCCSCDRRLGPATGGEPGNTLRNPASCAVSLLLGRLRLASAALDNLLRAARRNFLVGLELHRVVRSTLGVGPQVGGVAEHLRERNASGHREGVAATLLPLDPTAPAREVADHLTEEVLGRDDLDAEDRLEQDRLGAARSFLECERAGDLEGDLGGVRVVV